jgi:two-component system, chemotaxis family, CheB/CheR fusion protein
VTNPPATDGFEELIEFIRRDRGFDFTGYKRSSLMRRTIKRMRDVGIDSFPAYLEHLRTQPEEFVALFNTILINVTSFFRDGETWDYLAEHVVPQLLERRGEEHPVRVWSAGCATGQEAFSIGMLFAQAVGDDELARRVKIDATDIDEEALAVARHAAFAGKAMESVPGPLVDRFFERSGQRYTVARPLRRAVIFGRHNLAVDAPISRVDLMLCRNTMMYFSAPLQGVILDRIHYAMDPEGFLCLGKSEVMLTRSGHFEPVELKRRVFRSVGPRARYHALRPHA